jgi:hypothetical protein
VKEEVVGIHKYTRKPSFLPSVAAGRVFSMNHQYPPHGQGAHGLAHELHHHHQMPIPPSSYTTNQPVSQLPSMSGQSSSGGYADAYGQVGAATETSAASSSSTAARDPETEERSRQNLVPYSSVENGRRYAYVLPALVNFNSRWVILGLG